MDVKCILVSQIHRKGIFTNTNLRLFNVLKQKLLLVRLYIDEEGNLVAEDDEETEEPPHLLQVKMETSDYTTNLVEPPPEEDGASGCYVQLNEALSFEPRAPPADSALVDMQLGPELDDTLMPELEGGVLIEDDDEDYSLMQHMDIRFVFKDIFETKK